MKKFCVIGDPSNKPRFSSDIITTSLNKEIKELGLYDESGLRIKYDGCANSHNEKTDAFICSYEIEFPEIIKENAAGKPLIGVSLHNWNNIISSNYQGFSSWFQLGVDAYYFPIVPKTQNLDKFVFGLYSESLVRGGYEIVVEAFCSHFSHYPTPVKLIIKDRNATKTFIDYIEAVKSHYGVDIEYINEHWSSKEQIIDFASKIDVYINTNRCSTWNMPVTEMMAMGKPCIVTNYSGPAEFCLDGFNCLTPSFKVQEVSIDLPYLTALGCRNFFFLSGYKNPPVWAATDKNSLIDKMIKLINNKDLKEKIASNARLTAEKFTWQRSVQQLTTIVNQIC